MLGTPLLSTLPTQLGQDVERVSQTLQVSAAPVFMLTAVTSLLQALDDMPWQGCCQALRFALEQVHTRSRG